MSGKKDALKHLVEDVFSTREDEIQCEEAEAMMARCAEAGLSDKDARDQYPALWHHFRFCPDCAEEYRLVMALAQMENTGQLKPP
jgi:hypothetical protein